MGEKLDGVTDSLAKRMKFNASPEGQAYREKVEGEAKKVYQERVEEQEKLRKNFNRPSLNLEMVSGTVEYSKSYGTRNDIANVFPFFRPRFSGRIFFPVHHVLTISGGGEVTELDYFGGILPINSGTEIMALVFAGEAKPLEYLAETKITPPGNMVSRDGRRETHSTTTPLIYVERPLNERENVLQIKTNTFEYSPFPEGFEFYSIDSYLMVEPVSKKRSEGSWRSPSKLMEECREEAMRRVPYPK